MANTPSTVKPSDPLFSSQWHLLNTGQISGAVAGFDINVTPVWVDYTGKGVLVAVIDDGFDETHPDLVNNYRKDLSWDFALKKQGAAAQDGDEHGMAVAGLIAGTANNGIGGAGVAFGSQLVGYRASLLPSDMITDFSNAVSKMLTAGAAVSSNSWGVMDYPFDAQGIQAELVSATYKLASQGRNGLGTVTLFAAGNDRQVGANTNYDPTNNLPFGISVAASNADGLITSYSTPGASVLITAPGSDPASIVTTDRQGADGYNKAPGIAGNYTNTSESAFNGTSAAAPIAAGVVALMLQANPNLGYRDVQEILVYSSKRAVFLNQDGVEATLNTAKDWNGGGLLTGYDFGYGNIDALAAVRLAETWQKSSAASNLKILDGTVQQKSMSVAAGAEASARAVFTANARVEQITVTIDLDATRLQDLKLDLIAPGGTASTLINYPQALNTDGNQVQLPTHLNYTLDTVRDWGESLTGQWTLHASNNTTGADLKINNWSIKAYTADAAIPQSQIFTNEFITFGDAQAGRKTLSSTNGTTINAAAVTGATTIDLSGGTSHIGNIVVTLTDPQSFVGLISGDGADRLTGNGLNNLLISGRGNDYLNGAAGIDMAEFIGHKSDYTFVKDSADSGNWTVNSSLEGTDSLVSVERLKFSDKKIALDLSATGLPAQAAELLGAAFGVSTLSNTGFVGAVIGLFDSGYSMVDVSQAAIGTDLFKSLVGSSSNTDLVNLVYRNVAGRAPTTAETELLVSLLQGSSGPFSQAEFVAWAATTEANQLNINLAGLQTTGLEYI